MNLKQTVGLFLLAVLLLALNLQFSKKEDYYQDDFRQIITANVKLLTKEIASLDQTATDYKLQHADIQTLRTQLKNTRKAYKKVEYILEFYFPKHIKYYINGAPLNHLDPYPINEKFKEQNYYGVSPEEYSKSLPLDHLNTDHYKGKQHVVPPVGLQVLDEMIFSEEASSSREEIQKLTQELNDSYQILEKAISKRNFFYDYEIMEASRIELVRIFTMGITGFDTPGSLNAIEEASSSLQGLQEIARPLLQQSKENQKIKIEKLFANSISYLKKNKDFDTFDRLDFLTEYINPLYKELLEAQIALGIKSSSEINGKLPSWNAYSDNIFSEDFLNPYYYTLLKKNEDSESLRQLGKQLFYDKSLSKSGEMSCATCHKPELAFSDGERKSLASIQGKNVLRNSPTLINAIFSDKYFYDLRALDLEEQGEHVIENHLEFDTSFPELVKKLRDDKSYIGLFSSVFGKENKITRYQFSLALSSYVASLRSSNSPFDQYVQGKTKQIAPKIRQGFNLFMGKANCGTCHFAPTFSGLVPPLYHENESEVLGVMESPNSLIVDSDPGRIANKLIQDNEEIYRNSFKTSTVRNAKLTAPYFHNGAYNTLEEVIDFYNQGGAAGMGLSYEVPNQTLAPDKLNLTKKEIQALIAYIEALTDNPERLKK